MKRAIRTKLSLILVLLFAALLVACEPTVEEKPTMHKVTFNADNGTAHVVVEVENGKKVSRPTTDPVKDGFEFDDWYLNAAPYDFELPVTKSFTLTAKYDEIPAEDVYYTVTFDTVGAEPIAAVDILEGNKLTAPTAPTKDNFTFEGWTLDGELFDFDAPVTSNLKLKAKFNFIGIPDSPTYVGRKYNGDFDQLLNNFTSTTLVSDIAENAYIDSEQPYTSIGYSGSIGNNPDGALWKQAGSQNAESAAFQYLVLRLRGFNGASINDLSIGFRYGDNHEVLVVPLVETFDPDQENNDRELDGTWYNYVISITDTLDGKFYKGKAGYPDVEASGVLVGFHLMNTSGDDSGILEIKDAYFSKVPNPIYPYEGSDYNTNRDYWFETIGKTISSQVTINRGGHYGEFLEEDDLSADHTHVVLRLRQESVGIVDLAKLKIAPLFGDGSEADATYLSDIDELPVPGSGWLNVVISFSEIYDGDGKVTGYKLYNEGDVAISISQSFLSYLGQYEAVSYPLLDLENIRIFENFNRDVIGTTPIFSVDNEVALENGFSYLISYAGMQASTIGDGYITLDSTGGDFIDYVVHSESKGNPNEYRYLVFKYKLNHGATLDNFRFQQKTFNDVPLQDTVYANQFVAGLGLPSIPADINSYPYKDGDWTYLIIDLYLTEGLSTDFGGMSLYYSGSSLSIDSIFFANEVSNVDFDSEFLISDFEGLTPGSAQDQISDNQYWANVYDGPTTIVEAGTDNLAVQLDGTGYTQYHTGTKGMGRYLKLDLKVSQVGPEFTSFRVGPTGEAKWAKDGQLILANGTPMVVNEDGNWHTYIIDWVASGFELTDTIGFHASNGEIYLIDNIAWLDALPFYDEALLWGTWEWATVGDLNGQVGPNQYWMNNYGSASSIVEFEDSKWAKIDGSTAFSQIHTAVKAVPKYIGFDIHTEVVGGFGLSVSDTWKWNEELIGLDGKPIVLPEAGESAYVVIDVELSGYSPSDVIGFGANEGGVYLIDNVSFMWNSPEHIKYPVLTEDYEAVDPLDSDKYWWGEFALVNEGVLVLETAEYVGSRFGSPLIAGAAYLTFDVTLIEGSNADEFRIELGDGNIVYFNQLITDNVASELTTETQTVTIYLNDYMETTSNLEVVGFHINAGGVLIDNVMIGVNAYGHQMKLFTDN